MYDEIRWHIGKEKAPLDQPPYRAYFYWTRGGQIVRSADYSIAELEAEIERLKQGSENTAPFKDALRHLRRLG